MVVVVVVVVVAAAVVVVVAVVVLERPQVFIDVNPGDGVDILCVIIIIIFIISIIIIIIIIIAGAMASLGEAHGDAFGTGAGVRRTTLPLDRRSQMIDPMVPTTSPIRACCVARLAVCGCGHRRFYADDTDREAR